MVQHFGDFEILALPTWGHSMAIYPSAINNFLCSLFMCRRLWILWRLKICFLVPVLSTAVTLSLINFGTTCATSALGWRSHNIEGFSSTTVSTLVKTALATGMTGDMLITGGLCLSLNQNRSKFKETNRIINWISAYIISSCLLTTVTQAFVLVTYVAWPTTDIYIGIYHIVPKLYFNSLLATLNSRASLHKNHGVVNVSTDIPLSGDLSNLEQHSRGRSGVSGRPGNSRPQMLVQLDQQVETTTDSGKLDVIV
ncbi:hypothetical protein BT96DRAFT_980404 [Gymnopus androsaceus JB14]|uniref:DUF6534 domain-containing protein n=1 Tax=Gymnopus androsaceus JB14 TaxID=1447944 RepID=A0A6A4GWC5_9AGAR|nr:hypothetical protein BT96DRAFT_980404 [Gymnopus androsaceus JB14]